MADNKIEILWESPTHWSISIKLPVDDGPELALALMVDKSNFTINIPYFEFMNVESIGKVILHLYKDNPDNPVIKQFLSFLRQPENEEELLKFKRAFRLFH